MVNLTWAPPSELPGKHPYYEWNCGPKMGFARMSGKTNDTYTVLTGVAPRTWSCTVQAVMKTKIHMDKFGAKSSAVELLVNPAGRRHVSSWVSMLDSEVLFPKACETM